MTVMEDLRIGDVERRTGLTQRTLRYYEELGLLTPDRDAGGRRRYGSEELDRLYRVRLLSELGTALADVSAGDVAGQDLLGLTRRHLADLDTRLAGMARMRERVRAVEDRLLRGEGPSDEELLDLLSGMPVDEPAATRRLTLLVYRDLAAAHRHLVEVFGFGPGLLTRDGSGAVVHGEVHAGDGVIWLHPESEQHRLMSPASTGAASACMAVDVDDVEAHHARLRAAGARIEYEPTDMSYGVREYGARDSEGGLWSFMQVNRRRSDE